MDARAVLTVAVAFLVRLFVAVVAGMVALGAVVLVAVAVVVVVLVVHILQRAGHRCRKTLARAAVHGPATCKVALLSLEARAAEVLVSVALDSDAFPRTGAEVLLRAAAIATPPPRLPRPGPFVGPKTSCWGSATPVPFRCTAALALVLVPLCPLLVFVVFRQPCALSLRTGTGTLLPWTWTGR